MYYTTFLEPFAYEPRGGLKWLYGYKDMEIIQRIAYNSHVMGINKFLMFVVVHMVNRFGDVTSKLKKKSCVDVSNSLCRSHLSTQPI